MHNFRAKRRPIAEINIVPYVDVMLVLLVIFMVTAPLITQGIDVDLPAANAKPLKVKSELPIQVSVTKDAKLYLSIAQNPKKPIEPALLQAEVAAALVRSPKRQVVVKGDKNVSYDIVVQTMVLLQNAGVPSVGLETSNINSG